MFCRALELLFSGIGIVPSNLLELASRRRIAGSLLWPQNAGQVVTATSVSPDESATLQALSSGTPGSNLVWTNCDGSLRSKSKRETQPQPRIPDTIAKDPSRLMSRSVGLPPKATGGWLRAPMFCWPGRVGLWSYPTATGFGRSEAPILRTSRAAWPLPAGGTSHRHLNERTRRPGSGRHETPLIRICTLR